MKSLGFLSFVLFGVGVGYMLRRWPGDPAKTYSQNAARKQSSIFYYGALVMIFLALLCIFTYGWLVPNIHLPAGFVVVFGAGVLAQVVCAIVPETQGIKVTTHRAAAAAMYFLSVASVGILAASIHVPAASLIVWTTFALMAGTVGFAIIWKKEQHYALVFQTSHVIMLAVAFMCATYIR